MRTDLKFSPLLSDLVDALTMFPGVGPRSAQRMVFHLLKDNHRPQAKQLGALLLSAIDKIQNCDLCNNYTEETICSICASKKRNTDQICVVESPADILALEQSACYFGQYFVLMGALSPLDGIGPEALRLDKLVQRLKENTFQEIILATNATVEGEATADYIASLAKHLNIKTTRIAYGVPIGSELEHIDGNTLEKALSQRSLVSTDA